MASEKPRAFSTSTAPPQPSQVLVLLAQLSDTWAEGYARLSTQLQAQVFVIYQLCALSSKQGNIELVLWVHAFPYQGYNRAMRATVDLPDELLLRAKIRAVEQRTTLKALIEQGLRAVLETPAADVGNGARRRVEFLTVDGGLAPGLDLSNREAMHDWLRPHNDDSH